MTFIHSASAPFLTRSARTASGAFTDRPALREALDYARSGDTLIVWKLDRLARSTKLIIETIEKLRLRNIGFRSLTEEIDTTTVQGVLVFHMFSALAQGEPDLPALYLGFYEPVAKLFGTPLITPLKSRQCI